MAPAHPLIAVFGSSTVQEGEPAWADAEALGAALARAGCDIMNGGYGGVMEACSAGAHEAGGHVIGVTVELFRRRGGGNRFLDERIHASDLFERLRHLVGRADAFVILPGSVGTMTELFLTWTLVGVQARPRVPIVLLGSGWTPLVAALQQPGFVLPELFELVRVAATPEDAARLVRLESAPEGRAWR